MSERDKRIDTKRVTRRFPRLRRSPRIVAVMGWLGVAVVGLAGCEIDSFFDPSVQGRWEHTPVALPILENLDVIEQTDRGALQVTQVRPADLIPDVREYIIGPSDLLLVNIFELLVPGQDAAYQRRVDETGRIRLPQVGTIEASGLSPSQLEQRIGDILERKGILRDPTVSVVLAEARGNTFSILGPPEEGGSAFGTYQIPEPDFRLLDAIALARGVSERVKTLTIFRQVPLTPEVAGEVPESPVGDEGAETAPPPAPEDPGELIEDLMQGVEPGADRAPAEPTQPAAPRGIDEGLETPAGESQWVNVGGRWVRVGETPGAATDNNALPPARTDISAADQEEFDRLITQRLIEIPYDRLLAGDMRYNIVIRPGDIIRVPDRNAGFVYVMGAINRPGAYTVPGTNELTIKQIVASAGNLSQLAIPERVDLVRRIGPNQEAIVRLNVRAIFEGTQPDIFLKPNDLLNFGTSWVATPLAVVRNGFRASYGFGFVLDRNFADDVFGEQD